MNVTGACYALFSDSNDTLYCSSGSTHTVIKTALISSAGKGIIAAGTGTAGLTPNMLSVPMGIFVDASLNLYVSDYGNHRIQLFRVGELNATTVAGNGTTDTITLSYPNDVTLDIKGYLYILKRSHRGLWTKWFSLRSRMFRFKWTSE